MALLILKNLEPVILKVVGIDERKRVAADAIKVYQTVI